jgi:hypothetical protein
VAASRAWFVEHLPLGSLRQEIFDTHRFLDNATGQLVATCMAGAGFEYQPRTVAPTVVQFWDYGLLPGDDPSLRSDLGTDSDEPPLTPGVDDDVDPAYVVALFGSLKNESVREPIVDDTGRQVGFVASTGGCLGEAQDALLGSDTGYQEFASDDLLLQTLFSEHEQEFWSDPETLTRLSGFFECLIDSGFAVTQDFAAPIDLDALEPGLVRSAAEAEMSCKDSTKVIAAIYPLHYTSQSRFVDQQQGLLTRYDAWNKQLRGSSS